MTAIDLAIAAVGGRRQLAEACGVRYQAVQKWQWQGRIPAERVLTVERATGVPRGQLRPDLYPADRENEARTGTS